VFIQTLATIKYMIQGYTKWVYHNGINFYRSYIGDRPESFLLISNPEIIGLKQTQYADWFFKTSKGLLLQKWNIKKSLTSSLIFLDTNKLISATILESIPPQDWKIETKFNNKFVLSVKVKNNTLKFDFEL